MKQFVDFFINELLPALGETLKMIFISGTISTIFGITIGILLNIFSPQGIKKNKYIYNILSFVVNTIRSIPFLILGVLVIPLTMFITGLFGRATFFGTTASIVSLTIASTVFIAKMVESAAAEVGHSLIEAGIALGMTKRQIVFKIIFRESLPSIVNGIAIAMVSLLGISAVVQAWAGGGLGGLAYNIGIKENRRLEMVYIVIVIIVLVQLIQLCGNYLYKKLK